MQVHLKNSAQLRLCQLVDLIGDERSDNRDSAKMRPSDLLYDELDFAYDDQPEHKDYNKNQR